MYNTEHTRWHATKYVHFSIYALTETSSVQHLSVELCQHSKEHRGTVSVQHRTPGHCVSIAQNTRALCQHSTKRRALCQHIIPGHCVSIAQNTRYCVSTAQNTSALCQHSTKRRALCQHSTEHQGTVSAQHRIPGHCVSTAQNTGALCQHTQHRTPGHCISTAQNTRALCQHSTEHRGTVSAHTAQNTRALYQHGTIQGHEARCTHQV